MGKLLEKLKENGFSPRVIAVLEGGPVTTDLTPGELFILSKTISDSRIEELIHIDSMPFYGLIELLAREENLDEKYKNGDYLVKRMKEIAVGFFEKYDISILNDVLSEEEFYELLAEVENTDHCVELMEYAESEKQAEDVIAKMRTLNPSIDDWVNIANSAIGANPTHAIILIAIKEIELIANRTNELKDWLKLYECCIDRTDKGKTTLEKINTFNVSFETWTNIHKDDPISKTGKLALQKMQELKGNFNTWKNLLTANMCIVDVKYIRQEENIYTYFTMMLEAGNLNDLNSLYYEQDEEQFKMFELEFKALILQRMMTMIDSASK